MKTPHYEEGKYKVRIRSQGIVESKKADGHPSVQFVVEVLGMYGRGTDYSEFLEGEPDRSIFLTLAPGTMGTPSKPGWVVETLLFLGWSGKSLADLDPSSKSWED